MRMSCGASDCDDSICEASRPMASLLVSTSNFSQRSRNTSPSSETLLTASKLFVVCLLFNCEVVKSFCKLARSSSAIVPETGMDFSSIRDSSGTCDGGVGGNGANFASSDSPNSGPSVARNASGSGGGGADFSAALSVTSCNAGKSKSLGNVGGGASGNEGGGADFSASSSSSSSSCEASMSLGSAGKGGGAFSIVPSSFSASEKSSKHAGEGADFSALSSTSPMTGKAFGNKGGGWLFSDSESACSGPFLDISSSTTSRPLPLKKSWYDKGKAVSSPGGSASPSMVATCCGNSSTGSATCVPDNTTCSVIASLSMAAILAWNC
mmetsp:Transcript_5360/g.13201  ORF Transcript_5360/g.13201 Transcript_5360/m.13201 type:complete len:324 (-) Transcript_5360:466-1437(-)